MVGFAGLGLATIQPNKRHHFIHHSPPILGRTGSLSQPSVVPRPDERCYIVARKGRLGSISFKYFTYPSSKRLDWPPPSPPFGREQPLAPLVVVSSAGWGAR